MIASVRSFASAVTLAAAVTAGPTGFAQVTHDETGTSGAAQPSVRADEEVVVRGQSRAALRARIRIAEEAVYSRFNEINSSDDFDIHCRDEIHTGSRIPVRVCQANFWRDAQADAGEETARGLHGDVSRNTQEILAGAMHKRRQLAREIERLARRDPELLRSMTRLATLTDALDTSELPRPTSTVSRTVRAGEADLPYDARLRAEVSFADEPWTHRLTHPTFAIAEVFGEIAAVEVDCGASTKRLDWEAGAEWTLPDGAMPCDLRVEAAPLTTFALYEFE